MSELTRKRAEIAELNGKLAEAEAERDALREENKILTAGVESMMPLATKTDQDLRNAAEQLVISAFKHKRNVKLAAPAATPEPQDDVCKCIECEEPLAGGWCRNLDCSMSAQRRAATPEPQEEK